MLQKNPFFNVFGLAPGIVFGSMCAPISQLNLSTCVSMSFEKAHRREISMVAKQWLNHT